MKIFYELFVLKILKHSRRPFKSLLSHFNHPDSKIIILIIKMRYRANKPHSGVF
jgi:hypothetical protein